MVSCPTATAGVGCYSYRATSSASDLLPASGPSPPRHSVCSSRDTAASAPAHETKNNVFSDDFSSTRRRSRQMSTKRTAEFYSASLHGMQPVVLMLFILTVTYSSLYNRENETLNGTEIQS